MDKKRRNYKLLVDPMLRGGSTKIYRFEGVDPTVRNTEKQILREFEYKIAFQSSIWRVWQVYHECKESYKQK